MKHKYYYTDEEDKVIIRELAKNAGNLQKGFRDAGNKLNRSAAGVSIRWYRNLRNKTDCIFFISSSEQYIINGKNIVRLKKETERMHTTLWKRILRILNIK